jgi:hypothetical protein
MLAISKEVNGRVCDRLLDWLCYGACLFLVSQLVEETSVDHGRKNTGCQEN